MTRKDSRTRPLFLRLVLASLVVSSAIAQTAEISGTVTDASRRVIAHAQVNVLELNRNHARSTQTDLNGTYHVEFLLPGTYRVQVQARGMNSKEIKSLMLAGNDIAVQDFVLEVQSQSQSVIVPGQSPLLQAGSSTVVSTLPESLVNNLPLSTRNLTGLIAVTPGANDASSIDGLSSGQRPDDRRQTSSFSVNGQDDILNNVLIDGIDDNERIIGTVGVKPSIEAIEEVTVQTSLYTPESGRTSGAVVSVVTKSGTNELHGSLYEFFKNGRLNARNPFDPAPTFPKSAFHQNDFGGSLGGPVAKNRTFFFGAYEGFRQVAGVLNPVLSAVPTVAQQQSGPQNIINSDPQIPAGTPVDAIAARLFKLYPLPNIEGAGPGSPNYLYDPDQAQFSHSGDARVDHDFGSRDFFYARYTINAVTTDVPNSLPSVGVGNTLVSPGSGDYGFSGPASDTAYNLQLNYTHLVDQNLLFELKAGYSRVNNSSNSANAGTNAASLMGFPDNVNFSPASSGLPLIDITGLATLGDSRFIPLQDLNNTFQYTGSLVKIRGSHTLKAGATLIRRQARSVQSANANGAYTFGLNGDIDPLATFLAGAFTSVSRSNDIYPPDYRTWEPGMYIQDTWKVLPWLTLNYGARYDIFTPFTEAHNRISNFDLQTDRLLVAGVNGVSSTANIRTDYANLAPRIGFAASPGRGIVLRGGGGLTFFPANFTSNAGLKNPPFTSIFSPDCASPLAARIQKQINAQNLQACTNTNGQPQTLSDGIPAPQPQTINSPNLSLLAEQLNFKSGKVYQFSFQVQKQLGASVLSVGYIGNLGRNLPAVINNINVPNPTGLTPQQILAVQHPPTFTVLPNLTSIGYYESVGFSSYNSLQISLQRRYEKGLTVAANYVWSHAIDDVSSISNEGQQAFGNADPFDLARVEKGNSDLDLRQRSAISGTWEIPRYRGEAGIIGHMLSGWEVSGIFVWNTGNPFTITDAFTGLPGNIFNPGVGAAVPDRPMQIAQSSLANSNNDEYFNRNAFVIPPPGVIGNLGRNNLFGPSFRHMDVSLFRSFVVKDNLKLQVRAEAFNLTNTPAYFIANDQNHDPTTNLVPTLAQVEAGTVGLGFGQIVRTNPSYTPREIQFALKVVF
jgi:hypothetical protein